MKRPLAALLGILLVLSICVGCGPKGDISSGVAEQDFPVTVNEVTIQDEPKGVVVLSPNLAEVIMAYLDGEQYRLYGGSDKKSKEMNFAKITQFEGKRKTVMVIRNYLKDMLRRSRERSKEYQWNGWLKEENWIGWQGHVENLIKRLEELLEKEGDTIQFWNAGMQRAEKKQMMKLE